MNRRLDASKNEALISIARMGADAFGYTADLRIDRHLAELLRLRVSQLNNCTYRLNLHYQAAREAGIPRAKIDTLTAWWETELHSEAEQAALRYAEALTRAADTDWDAAFQRFHDALAENFTPEILEIVGVVINMNVWTRMKLAEGATPGARPHGGCAVCPIPRGCPDRAHPAPPDLSRAGRRGLAACLPAAFIPSAPSPAARACRQPACRRRLSGPPASEAYASAWETTRRSGSETLVFTLTLREWVNSGLMTFFVVALEVRREFDLGELRGSDVASRSVLAGLGA